MPSNRKLALRHRRGDATGDQPRIGDDVRATLGLQEYPADLINLNIARPA
jgi:hypothetical protein